MTDLASTLTPLDDPPDAPADEMYRRERAWQSTRRAEAMWPGLDARVLQSAADAIGVAVAAVLRGERPRLDFPALRRDAERSAHALGVSALLTGVGPLLGAWLARDAMDADELTARVLARHLAHGRARIARIRSEVLPILARMEAEGLAPAVIKGFHTAHAYFPEAGARPMADVDVVVAPEHIARAVEILREAGLVTEGSAPTAYKREWTRPGDEKVWSHELWHARSTWRIELHDGLNFNAVVANVDTPQTPTLRDMMTIDGVALRVADPNELIALVATHGSTELYSQRLLRLVEVVLIARRAHALGQLDWAAVEENLALRRTLPFAYPLLVLVEQLAPGTVDWRALGRVREATTRRIREVTERFTPTAPILDEPFSLRERLLWVSGVRGTLRRLWRMVAPLEHGSARARLLTYHDRVIRLVAMGVRLRARARPKDDGET
jgi:hypothetical protein